MIKTQLFLDYMNNNNVTNFWKSVEKGNRGELGNILELKIGYTCNNNCKLCSIANKRHLKDRTTEECKDILKENRKERNLLIISGGEPTIREDISDLIAYARDINYQWIQLKTNGRMFYYKDFAEKFIDIIKWHPLSDNGRNIDDEKGYNFPGLDIFEFYISIYDSSPKNHDYITNVSKSFGQTLEGIKNLLELNQIVVINVIINKLNYKRLSEILRYLYGLGVKYIDFSFVNLSGNVIKNFEELVPSTTDIRPYILESLKNYENLRNFDKSRILMVNSFPRCFFKSPLSEKTYPYNIHLSEKTYPYDRHFMYKLVDIDTTKTYYENQVETNTKGEKCIYCIYDPICFGFNKNYIEKMGFGDLDPVLGNFNSLVENDKKEFFKNIKNIDLSNLKFEFDDPKLKLNFNDVKADVISLLSGGVDSTMATAIYARCNENKKIALITFDESHSPGAKGSYMAVKYLMERYKNIVGHFIISIPYILSKKIIYEDIENEYKKFGLYLTCRKCKYLRLSYCIYLLKKYFLGNEIIAGFKNEEGVPLRIYENFLNKYFIRMTNPLYSLKLTKKDVVELAERDGFCSLGPSQSKCLLSSLKSRLKKTVLDKKIQEEIENKYHMLSENLWHN